MNAQGGSGFGSEDRVIFAIVGVLLLLLVVVLWIVPNQFVPSGELGEEATFTSTKPVKSEKTDVKRDEVGASGPSKPSESVEAVTEEAPLQEEQVSTAVNVDTHVPSFDLVRVEEGLAMVAGQAAPNTDVRLMADGQELAKVRTDASGKFALFADVPRGDTPLNLTLETDGDEVLSSAQQVLVVPSKTDENAAPKIVIAQADGDVEIQQPTESGPSVQALSLDMINYTNRGDVVFAGRGSADQSVRVYVDNKPVSLGAVDNGTWEFEVPDIKEGIYTVRVDAVDETGQVVERIESPFQRVIAEMDAGAVTIQPGFTLWQLAEIKYGSGERFVQIFDANRDLIKDPDMIFPGQIFDVPEQ